jgi:pyruvate dehydrogenase E2 component (dihydrolipoamide acetyltransferase)
MSEPYTIKQLGPLRKVIAAHMSEAKRTIPHFRVAMDIVMDRLLAARAKLNSEHPHGRVSVNDCLLKACGLALMRHPDVNSQLVDDRIHQCWQADISVVVAIEGGLATPVVRAADRKSLQEIAAETTELIRRATAGQLKMHEIVGGSFSVSNLGAYDIKQFDAIINPPQCAILAVGRAKPTAVATQDGEIRVATVMRATLSADHRVIDGATAAAFLTTLQGLLERPQEII